MNKQTGKHRDAVLWVLGIVMLILSFFLAFHLFSFSEASHRIFSSRVQKAVQKEEDRLKATKASFLGSNQAIPASVGLYVYRNDSLLFWNTNLVEPKLLRKRVPCNTDTIVNLNIGDFLVSSTLHNNCCYCFFTLLNTTYPVENKYFVNRFQPVLGNHQIRFQAVGEESESVYTVHSRSGKPLSYYTIDFPTGWGSSNLSLLVVCIALLLLCIVLLILRLITARQRPRAPGEALNEAPGDAPAKHGLLWPVLALLASVALVWFGFRQLFRLGFDQGFFIPDAIKFNYCFLALFVGLLALVGLCFLLWWLWKPWVGGRNAMLVMIGQLVFWGILLTLDYDREYRRFENAQIIQKTQSLAMERDLAFERSYGTFFTEAQADPTFNDLLRSDDLMAEVAMDYLRGLLFDSVMNQYNLELTLSSPGQELDVRPYLNTNYATKLDNGLYCIDENTLDPHYFSVLTVGDSLQAVSVYLEFSKPLISHGFGLPKLIHDDQDNLLLNASVACYRDSVLIYKYGSYIYPNFLSDYKHPVNTFSYGRRTKHYLHQSEDGKIVALSCDRRSWTEATLPFVFFFFLLLVLFLLLYFLGNARRDPGTPLTLSRRFQMVVLLALGVSFLLVGPVSVLYLRSLYTQKVNETHFDRTRTLSLDITSEVDFSFLKTPGFKAELDAILRHYSETFFTDINVYDIHGRMLATTTPELNDLQLQSSLMNAEAYHNMQGERSLYYIHEETMGNAVYQSSYISIQDEMGKTLAYLNLPYFTSRSDLRSEIVRYVLTYINLMLLLIFIFLPLVLVITRKVTDPLVQLQEKMRRIDINRTNETLEWKRNDEIGALINQYNQLVVKLEESAAELKRTTAESAWRGVARQVAHEIHNSLTPMRLSVQMLQRSTSQQGTAEDERLQRTAATLLEQIDALSDIASSFSQYAKLPVNNPQPLDLAELVGNLVNLYDTADNIEFHYEVEPDKDYTFNGDKTNLNSAIGNIIKNATQAIGLKPDGRIEVRLRSTGTSFVVSVKDNGKGIKEEDKKMIFVPNFTTKTGGSGVGLSLAYNIVISAGGSLTFESQEGEGTEFVVVLPNTSK